VTHRRTVSDGLDAADSDFEPESALSHGHGGRRSGAPGRAGAGLTAGSQAASDRESESEAAGPALRRSQPAARLARAVPQPGFPPAGQADWGEGLG
jgi:hypothetical protein